MSREDVRRAVEGRSLTAIKYAVVKTALKRTGHYPERGDHHAQVCPLCTALRTAEGVTLGPAGTRPPHLGGTADQQQREHPA